MKYHCLLIALLASAFPAMAALPHTVATDDLGTPGGAARVQSGSPWTMPASVKTDDHSIIFGEEVSLGYHGAVPGASYEVELTFASDSGDRKVRILADDAVLAQELALPLNGEIKRTYQIPATVTADGRFELRIQKLGGPNAVLSAASVRSSNPQALGVPPFSFPEVTLTPLPYPDDCRGSLNGTWKFLPQAPADIAGLTVAATAAWTAIEVPGQWRNQGHDLPPSQTVAYATTFNCTASSPNHLAKIRFEAVFSQCQVYLNGQQVGAHIGGFTPFECDVTKALKDKDNLLVVTVTSASLADAMASATQYACHPLGGISRDVTLFDVPETYISDLAIRTDFDAAYKDANLAVALEIIGTGTADLTFNLRDPAGKAVPLANATASLELPPVGPLKKTFTFPVSAPQWWTPETPALYQLDIYCGIQIIRQNIGFREIEVKGTRVLVNGRPVKLRGINRHEANPLRGRSLASNQWRTDVQLFRDANVNLIRTCHYPPSHHLVEAADELGVWVELESPFCWEGGANDPSHRELAMRQTAEAIKRDRNNPSVLYWSLGNESSWGKNFELSSKMVRELDPTRPQTFETGNPNINDVDAGNCQIGVVHYPGFNGPIMAKEKGTRPLFMGEYCHLNAYNRRELMTDPGLRDRWGLYLHRLWEQMDAEPNILGGAIWSGIDDTFFPGEGLTLGYGAWGPIDGWRRTKPEYWHVKKVYSPVRIDETKAVNYNHGTLTIPVENRSDFVNLSALECRWKLGKESGTLRADIPSRQRGELVIKLQQVTAGTKLELSFHDARGFITNEFRLPIGSSSVGIGVGNPMAMEEITTSEAYVFTDKVTRYRVDRRTGAISVQRNGMKIINGGPHLMLIPENNEGETQMTGKTKIHDAFSPVCTGWQLKEVTTSASGEPPSVKISGSYAEAEGFYLLRFTGNEVRFSYDFKAKQAINARQTGVAFDFAPGFDQLTWSRFGLWSTYPDDHIGRRVGTALAVTPDGKDAIEIGPRENPGKSPWANDNTRYGSNDFRSTKENILTASLGQPEGPAIRFTSDGSQSVRAWRDPATRCSLLLIANYTSGGSERFLQALVAPDKRPLKPGDTVKASFQIN